MLVLARTPATRQRTTDFFICHASDMDAGLRRHDEAKGKEPLIFYLSFRRMPESTYTGDKDAGLRRHDEAKGKEPLIFYLSFRRMPESTYTSDKDAGLRRHDEAVSDSGIHEQRKHACKASMN